MDWVSRQAVSATPSGPQLRWFRADTDRRAVVRSRASRVVLGNGNRECFLSDTRRIIDCDIPKRFLRARRAGMAGPKVHARTSRIGRSSHCETRTTATFLHSEATRELRSQRDISSRRTGALANLAMYILPVPFTIYRARC